MVALPENVQRFANWSGAKLRPDEKPALEVDMPNFVADKEADTAQSMDETPTEGLVEQKFERNKAPWKNPNVTLGTAIGLACAASAVGFFIFNSNVQWPTMGGPSLGSANNASNDDLEPVDHPDGKVQTAALTTNLGGGLDQDANPSNPFTTIQKPTDKATGKTTTTAQGKGATPGKGTTTTQGTTPASANPVYPTTTAYTTASTTPTVSMTRRTVTRPTYTDYNDGAVTRPTYSRTASVSSNYPRTYSVGYSRSAVSSSGSSSQPSARVSTISTPAPSNSSQPKLSPEERRQAAIASTSTMGGASDKVASVQGVQSTNAVAQVPQTSGYQDAAYLTAEDAVLSGIPQQLINRSQKAVGRLLMGVAFIPGDTEALNGQPVEIAIEDPLKSGLPADARIEAIVEFPKAEGQLKSAVIRLTPKAIAIGDAEYPLPAGTVILTGQNGQPLIAKRQGSEFLRAIGSTAKTILGGTIGGLSTLAFGNGTGILSGLGGGLNGLGGLSNVGRSSAPQQATEILALRENTVIQVNIVKPLTLPIQADAELDPTSTHAAVPQPMMFTQDITDAQLMAIANEHSDSTRPVQPTGLSQSEVQDAQ